MLKETMGQHVLPGAHCRAAASKAEQFHEPAKQTFCGTARGEHVPVGQQHCSSTHSKQAVWNEHGALIAEVPILGNVLSTDNQCPAVWIHLHRCCPSNSIASSTWYCSCSNPGTPEHGQHHCQRPLFQCFEHTKHKPQRLSAICG